MTGKTIGKAKRIPPSAVRRNKSVLLGTGNRQIVSENITADDREFILKQFSDREVTRYLFDTGPLSDISGADEIIELFIQPEPRAQHRWILVKKNNGAKIGTCGFHRWDRSNGRCELGYDLYPDHRGKGYMLEALKAICAFARSNMKVKSIDARIYIDNEKSVKLAEKLGFTFNGLMIDEIFHGKAYPHKILTLDCTIRQQH
jgi:ribosomal-protein-alanine N-acetyltransferase